VKKLLLQAPLGRSPEEHTVRECRLLRADGTGCELWRFVGSLGLRCRSRCEPGRPHPTRDEVDGFKELDC
jgi:hypothetical protein